MGGRLALDRLGHELGDLVGLGERDRHGARDVADAAARLELVHGDDLADVVLAVLVGDVADDLVAPVHAEVDVEVRHQTRSGFRKRSNSSLYGDRIEVGDAHRVGDERAGARAAARARPGCRCSLAWRMKSQTMRK